MGPSAFKLSPEIDCAEPAFQRYRLLSTCRQKFGGLNADLRGASARSQSLVVAAAAIGHGTQGVPHCWRNRPLNIERATIGVCANICPSLEAGSARRPGAEFFACVEPRSIRHKPETGYAQADGRFSCLNCAMPGRVGVAMGDLMPDQAGPDRRGQRVSVRGSRPRSSGKDQAMSDLAMDLIQAMKSPAGPSSATSLCAQT